jgi:hypothetical protein
LEEKKKDIIDSVKDFFKSNPPVVEGSPDAYDILAKMTDDQVKKYYMGKAPYDPKTDTILVPKEAQEELFKRFVQPHAHYNCKVCYGRGRAEWIPALRQYKPCDCLQRIIRKEVAKENEGYLYDPSGNKINFSN